MTKRHDFGSAWMSKWRRGATAMAAIGMVGSLAMTSFGCDTVARISFEERNFQGIRSTGFIPPAGSCDGVGSDGKMKLRFVLLDNNNSPIIVGQTVNNQSVELNSSSITLEDSAIMEPGTDACSSDSECTTTDFSCTEAPGLNGGAGASNGANLKTCNVSEPGLTVDTASDAVKPISDTTYHQVFGLLMENSGSLEGWNLPGTEGAWDKNANGQIDMSGNQVDTTKDLPPSTAPRVGVKIASDPGNKRLTAVHRTFNAFVNAASIARSKRRKSYFGLWSFNSNKIDPTSYIQSPSGDGLQWSEDAGHNGRIYDAIKRYEGLVDGDDRSNVDASGANVYESITKLIQNQFTTDVMQNKLHLQSPESVDKLLVVFVDGYDDLRATDGSGITVDDAIQAATDNHVRLFIVQLDSKLENPELLRENPDYWKNQSPCTSDDQCKNFEECRKPRGYYKNQSGSYQPVETDPAFDNTYCMPKRDDTGRIGPIQDYERLACATGGGYMYVPSPAGLARNISWTPYALDGLWEASVSSAKIERGKAPKGAIKLQTTMGVSVGGSRQTYSFSQLGDVQTSTSDSTVDDFDTRSVVFTAQ